MNPAKNKLTNNVLNLIGNTPLVKVSNIDTGHCDLYLKLESFNLGGSIKDRPAKRMIMEAESNGLKKGGSIVEATAGNTGIGLAMIANLRGYKSIIVVPDKMSIEKIYHLRALGAEVIITRSDVLKGHPEYYIDLAMKISGDRGAFYINQFSNQANLDSHYFELGPEIFSQINGKIDAFVAGVGTGGTISGVGKYLKEKNSKIELVLADPHGSVLKQLKENGTMPEEIGSWIVEGIGEDFHPPLLNLEIIDKAFTIYDSEAVEVCNELLKKECVLSGSSSGTLIAAALKYCREQKYKKNVVTLVCDAGDKYLRKVYNNSWLKSEGLGSDKNKNNLKDILLNANESNALPVLSDEANIELAYKLIREYSVDSLAVKDKDNNVTGVIRKNDLLRAAINSDLKEKIYKYLYKAPKIDIAENTKDLFEIFANYDFAMAFDNDDFVGVIDCMDIVSYVRRKEKNENN